MRRVYYSRKAVQDLEEIWLYSKETWSEQQADIYYELIINQCNHIANYPQIGRDYSALSKNVRGFKVGKHIIFYTHKNRDSIKVLRILHESMNTRLYRIK